MSVVLLPDAGEIEIKTTVSVDRPASQFEFVLNSGLAPTTDSGELEALKTSADGLRTAYRVSLQTAGQVLELHYRGRPRFSGRRTHGDMPLGIIAERGVYLDASSAWYPLFDRPVDRLALNVKRPEGWHSVSIGRRSEHGGQVRWTTAQPHDDIYLIAGRFTRYARRHRDIDLSVWLLGDDPALAERYLAPMGDYIDHYSRLIGDYPFAKFAVVENPWQTGFGMPSFTLLGSRVIRLPFIPYTSLPHEILHNWWGNGVWVDYAAGNWSEGLTAYLADHWMKAREGKAAQYRLKALQRYSNFAADGEDLPLLEFVSRHDDASQSIGYSKSLMLFHMLRTRLGDQAFVAGLQDLWQRHRFTRVGFREALAAIAGGDSGLLDEFAQWLERPGAPRLTLGQVEVHDDDGAYRLVVPIGQAQAEPPFSFELPLAVVLAGEDTARRLVARVTQRTQRLEFRLPARPLRLDVDPSYDQLRYLDPTEQPPALNRLFGGNTLLVLPTGAPPAMREAWRELARQWQRRYPGLRLVEDPDQAAADMAAERLLVLGWDNRLFDAVARRFDRPGQRLHADAAEVQGERFAAADASVVLVSNDAEGATTGFIGAPSPQAIRTLARKLPHYGSYSRLVFEAASGDNLLRDTLPAAHSRLSRQLGEQPVALELPTRPPLGKGP